MNVKAGDYELCLINNARDNSERTVSFTFSHGEGFSHKEFATKGILFFLFNYNVNR